MPLRAMTELIAYKKVTEYRAIPCRPKYNMLLTEFIKLCLRTRLKSFYIRTRKTWFHTNSTPWQPWNTCIVIVTGFHPIPDDSSHAVQNTTSNDSIIIVQHLKMSTLGQHPVVPRSIYAVEKCVKITTKAVQNYFNHWYIVTTTTFIHLY